MAVAIRNLAGQTVGAQLVSAATGGAFGGAVTVYVTGDTGTQTLGASNSGVAVNKGNGYYTYTPTQAETDFVFVAYTFVGTGAIPQTIEGPTETIAQATAISAATTTSASARTAQDLITGAFRRLNIFDASDAIPPTDMAYGYTVLNELIDSWNTEQLLMSVDIRSTYTLVANQSTYLIGPTGDFVAAVPPGLRNVAVIPVGLTIEIPVSVLTRDQYAAIPNKALTNLWPTGLNYEITSPNATIIIYPVPTTTATLVLYVQAVLSQFASLTTTYSFPPGYARALRDNLAAELAPSYERVPSAALFQSAADAKRAIKIPNVAMQDAAVDPAWAASARPSNVYTGS